MLSDTAVSRFSEWFATKSRTIGSWAFSSAYGKMAATLGEGGWLKALKLRGYVARGPRRPPALQQALFAYAETL